MTHVNNDAHERIVYCRVEIGGFDTLNDILRGLWRYPDFPHDKVTLTRAFLRAVVVFCETLRLLSVLLQVFDRIRMNSDASPLQAQSWKRIKHWSSACEFVLDTAGKCHGNIDAETFREKFHDKLGFETFDEIIDELRIFNWQDSLLKLYKGDTKRWLKRKQPGTEIGNPLFDAPDPINAPGQFNPLFDAPDPINAPGQFE